MNIEKHGQKYHERIITEKENRKMDLEDKFIGNDGN